MEWTSLSEAVGECDRGSQHYKTGDRNLYTSLPKLSGCDLNLGPSAPESSTLTTLLPSHPISAHWVYVYVYSLHSLVYNIL